MFYACFLLSTHTLEMCCCFLYYFCTLIYEFMFVVSYGVLFIWRPYINAANVILISSLVFPALLDFFFFFLMQFIIISDSSFSYVSILQLSKGWNNGCHIVKLYINFIFYRSSELKYTHISIKSKLLRVVCPCPWRLEIQSTALESERDGYTSNRPFFSLFCKNCKI